MTEILKLSSKERPGGKGRRVWVGKLLDDDDDPLHRPSLLLLLPLPVLVFDDRGKGEGRREGTCDDLTIYYIKLVPSLFLSPYLCVPLFL